MASNENKALAVGDIIEWNVGYSMVLPHFAIIVGFTPSGKSARIRELGTKFTDSDGYGQVGWKTPDTEKRGPVRTCRIKANGGHQEFVSVDGHWTHLWDGKPSYYDSMD